MFYSIHACIHTWLRVTSEGKSDFCLLFAILIIGFYHSLKCLQFRIILSDNHIMLWLLINVRWAECHHCIQRLLQTGRREETVLCRLVLANVSMCVYVWAFLCVCARMCVCVCFNNCSEAMVLLCIALLTSAMLCYAMLCYAMLCYAMLC